MSPSVDPKFRKDNLFKTVLIEGTSQRLASDQIPQGNGAEIDPKAQTHTGSVSPHSAKS